MSMRAAPPLLASDREQLDRVVRLLRDSRRAYFAIVCSPELRPAALRYLSEQSGKVVPEPLRVEDHDAMVDAVRAIDGKPVDTVDCLSVGAPPVDAWTALNWLRGKLVKGGQVLLWLDSVEDLREMREHAPDAYSFREAVLVLEGEGLPAQESEREEPPDIKTLRLLYELPRAPDERAEAAVELIKTLNARGYDGDVIRIAKEALALIPKAEYSERRHVLTRVTLYQALAVRHHTIGRNIEAFRMGGAGLADLAEIPDRNAANEEAALWLELSAAHLSPLGAERDLVEEALRTLSIDTIFTHFFTVQIIAAESARRRGRFRRAIEHCTRCLDLPRVPFAPKANGLETRSRTWMDMGRFDDALNDLKIVQTDCLQVGHAGHRPAFLEAQLFHDKAEVSASSTLASKNQQIMILSLNDIRQGKLGSAVGRLEKAIAVVFAQDRDAPVFSWCTDLIGALRRAHGAASGADLMRALTLIEAAGQTLIDYAAGDPPWYRVLFPGLRAQILSLFDSRHEEALAAASEGVVLARSLWEQALPRATRILVQCLARADRWREMDAAIAEALQTARDADHLIELATVQAYDLARLIRLQTPKETVERALTDLRATFSEMDAPRVEGESWLEIAPYLPPLTTTPDLIAIADRAHDLFFDMPMPEPAARCMEWLGDIYTARGDRPRAESCYRMSLGTLERYGLLSRKPLVEKKLAATAAHPSAAPSAR